MVCLHIFVLKFWFILNEFISFYHIFGPKSDSYWWRSLVFFTIFCSKSDLFRPNSWKFTRVLAQNPIHIDDVLWFHCRFLCSKSELFWQIYWLFSSVLPQNLIHIEEILCLHCDFCIQTLFVYFDEFIPYKIHFYFRFKIYTKSFEMKKSFVTWHVWKWPKLIKTQKKTV